MKYPCYVESDFKHYSGVNGKYWIQLTLQGKHNMYEYEMIQNYLSLWCTSNFDINTYYESPNLYFAFMFDDSADATLFKLTFSTAIDIDAIST